MSEIALFLVFGLACGWVGYVFGFIVGVKLDSKIERAAK